MSKTWQCNDCGSTPCRYIIPDNDTPEVCPLVGDEGNPDAAHFCNWREVVPRRGRKKT
jgi:hypothetical protein